MSFPCVRLEEVCDFLSGFAWSASEFESEPTGLPIIRIQNVDAVRESDFVYWGGAYDERFIIRSGDILLTLSGSFRAEVWPGPDALLNQRIVKLTPKGAISPDWLLYVVRHKLAEIAGMGRHALVSNVALADLRALSVPLPPLSEQRRIAAILDKADALRTKRREALAQLDRLAQSIFVEMFGPESGIPTKNLGSLAQMKRGPFGGALKKEIFVSHGPMVFEQRNAIQDDCLTGRYFITEAKYREMEDFAVLPNDLIVSCSGTIGKVAIVPEDAPQGIINQALLRIRTNNAQILPIYLKCALESKEVQNRLTGLSHGTGLQNFPPMSEVKSLAIPLPPLSEQAQFQDRLLAVHKQKLYAEKSGENLDALFTSLQHRAFRGEL